MIREGAVAAFVVATTMSSLPPLPVDGALVRAAPNSTAPREPASNARARPQPNTTARRTGTKAFASPMR